MIVTGDCVEVMAGMEPESVDAIVTDPPYWYNFMGKAWDGGRPDEDAGFGYYFSGLVDGEGHFRVQRHVRDTYSCAFSIHLRRDDRAILEQVRRFLGVGSITEDQSGDRSPMARLNVQAKADCLRVVEVLTRYPLRAKKLRDFLPWAEAVLEWNEMKRGHRWSGRGDWSRLERLKATIERAREYREIPWSGNSYQDWTREWAEQALRVLKPGGHLLSFSGTRTYHRMTSGLEDAGFEIRDCLVWAYASGFPKSLDVSKAIDRAAGAEREKVPIGKPVKRIIPGADQNATGSWIKDNGREYQPGPEMPATDAARQWDGWGTALKPAWEPIVMARKPLRGTVAANVQRFGTGALNIDATRIGTGGDKGEWPITDRDHNRIYGKFDEHRLTNQAAGRWPANLLLTDPIFDGDTPGVVGGGETTPLPERPWTNASPDGALFAGVGGMGTMHRDSGTYSRFFLIPKAARSDREPLVRDNGIGALRDNGRPSLARQNGHPTVKPLDLMRHLVRLVTPPGGTVLDCFLGSGTTGIACEMEGFAWIGIEKEPEYVAIAEARLNGVQRGLGLDVPAAVKPKAKSKGHWPKSRTPGKDGWGFSGQEGLLERVDEVSA